jgi:signal transduction histidine kinase
VTRRLLVSYLAITIAVLAILTYPLARNYRDRRLTGLTSGLVQDAFLIASQVQESVELASAKPTDIAWIHAKFKGELRAVVLTRDGQVILDSAETLDPTMANRPEIVDMFAKRGVVTGHRRSNTLNTELAFVVVPVVKGDAIIGAVRLSFPTTAVQHDVVNYWKAIAATSVVSLVLVAIIGIVLSRYIARPIKELERAAVEFGDGKLDRRAPDVGGPPEVVSLRNAFNRTANGLETLVKRQQAFVADASHQFRTPLTGLRLRLENLEGEVTEQGTEDLEQAVAQTDRLSRMVDGLLTLARADRSTTWHDSQPVLLQHFLHARITDWEPFASERSISVTSTCPPGLMVMSNADRLSQVVDNLIANAFDALGRTDRTDQAIHLLVWHEPEFVEIHVVDNGPGLSATERARAFDRFWRKDPSQTDGFGGTGLGLSIAATMLAADKGTIRLDEASGGGMDAVIRLHRGDVPERKPHTKPHR